MKYLILLILLVSCGKENNKGQAVVKPKEACIQGVVYYYKNDRLGDRGYMAPKYTIDGFLEECFNAQ